MATGLSARPKGSREKSVLSEIYHKDRSIPPRQHLQNNRSNKILSDTNSTGLLWAEPQYICPIRNSTQAALRTPNLYFRLSLVDAAIRTPMMAACRTSSVVQTHTSRATRALFRSAACSSVLFKGLLTNADPYPHYYSRRLPIVSF
jgi:hypothetical protein